MRMIDRYSQMVFVFFFFSLLKIKEECYSKVFGEEIRAIHFLYL